MSGPAAAATPDDDPRTRSPLRWLVLVLCALGIFSSYYESDAIGPIADLLLRQRHLTQFQIGDLTAVISLPNIVLAVFTGVLIDRYGPARVSLWAAVIGFAGAVLTAVGEPYALMWTGRLIFGVSEGSIFISLLAGVARWFPRSGVALATAIFLSLARVGSYTLDKSPTWARALYEDGWQPPLWLGAAITGVGLVAVLIFRILDARWPPPPYAASNASERVNWRDIWGFDRSYWYILGLHCLYAAVFATPLFGLLADRIGHRALLLTVGTLLLPITLMVLSLTDLSPWLSTALMGVSFSMVPAIIWPATTLIVEPRRLGTALGVITLLQNLALWGSNRIAGWLATQAGAGPDNPAGYDTMIWFFGAVSIAALISVLLLWQRESGPHGHGLENARATAS